MKSNLIAGLFLLIFSVSACMASGQNKWFQAYSDSAALESDANKIIGQFIQDVRSIKSDVSFQPRAILRTTPMLIFFRPSENTVNLPLWQQLTEESKSFFHKISDKGKAVETFGLFFNGFYLPHELGHAYQHAVAQAKLVNGYDNEYRANVIAMLWWRKQGKHRELKRCYQAAKKILAQLPNPVPEGQTVEAYFTENYSLVGKDPFVYGYMQFGQFIKIYEDKTLPDFDELIRGSVSVKD